MTVSKARQIACDDIWLSIRRFGEPDRVRDFI